MKIKSKDFQVQEGEKVENDLDICLTPDTHDIVPVLSGYKRNRFVFKSSAEAP